jgi:nucleotide-binding universal stress UspA family protein
MLTLRRRISREDVSVFSSGDRPVLLATLDVPFSEEATAFAVDSAVESGMPLVVVNAAEVLPTAYTLLGYGYVEREELQEALRKPAELAHSLAVPVERLRVCSPHPVDALLEVAAERNPAILVFGPDRAHLPSRRYRRAERAVCERAPCLVWTATS